MDTGRLLDVLVEELESVGLKLNVAKTVALTTQAQPPDFLNTPEGRTIKRVCSHRWLGCILNFQSREEALSHHLLAANKAFHANKWLLKDKHVSLVQRLDYFNKVITPVACFAAGRRVVYQSDLQKLDVAYRKLIRQVCGPPGNIDWSRPWHEVLHDWNEKVERVTTNADIQPWSLTCLRHYWKFGAYCANLPDDRWVKRVLRWAPSGHRSQGRPRDTWETAMASFCNVHSLGHWEEAAKDQRAWLAMLGDFLHYMTA